MIEDFSRGTLPYPCVPSMLCRHILCEVKTLIKITLDKRSKKEQITIDPYIPIDIKFGNWNEVEESPRYCRFGDFKKSLLEVGVSSISGQLRSITLVEAKDIYINSSNRSYEILNCEKGLPVLNDNRWEKTERIDIQSHLKVSTLNDKIIINIRTKYQK